MQEELGEAEKAGVRRVEAAEDPEQLEPIAKQAAKDTNEMQNSRNEKDGEAPKTVRIVDIALMAGVSTATVDRVIHNRGKVSAENLARIQAVLEQVDYRPNLIARSLASGRRYVVAVVMPRFSAGE